MSGEPRRGSLWWWVVYPTIHVPAAHHCGVCTVVIASGDAGADGVDRGDGANRGEGGKIVGRKWMEADG